MPSRRLLLATLAIAVVAMTTPQRMLFGAAGGPYLPTDMIAFYNRQVAAGTYRLFAATSNDAGVTFTTGNTPLIDVGAGGSWNDTHLAHASVIPEDGGYALYASGYDGSTWRFGRWTSATLSTNPADWTADPANPLRGPTGSEDGTWVPQARPDPDLELTGIWYLVLDGSTFSTYYLERDWATGTITDFGEVIPHGGSGDWNEIGSDGGAPHEVDGQKRLYVGGQAASSVSASGWASYTDPQDAGTYELHDPIFVGPITVDDGEFDTTAITSIVPYGDGFLAFGSLIHPTGEAGGREIAVRATSPDGLTFGTWTGAIIPMATAWPSNESRENPNVHVVP